MSPPQPPPSPTPARCDDDDLTTVSAWPPLQVPPRPRSRSSLSLSALRTMVGRTDPPALADGDLRSVATAELRIDRSTGAGR